MASRPSRLLSGALALGSVAMLVSSVLGGDAAEWVFVAATVSFPAILIGMGLSASPRRGPALFVLGGLTALLGAGACTILLLHRGFLEAAPILGLPAATAVMLLVLGLAPLLLVAWGYAAASRDR